MTGPPAVTDRPRSRRTRRLLRWSALAVLAVFLVVTVAAAGYDVASRSSPARPAEDANGHAVPTGDLLTHYEQWGDGGTPIVLVHGFLESAQTWRLAGPLLAAQGHRVYALDIRGYGDTMRRGPYTLASDTAQLRSFLTALHLTAADGAAPLLVGHSSGAAIVGNLARLNPGVAAGIVFMDGDGTPYGVGPGWAHRLFVDPYATALIRLLTHHPSLARHVYASACGPGCPPFDPTVWSAPFREPGAESALKAILRRQLIGLTYAQKRAITTPAAVLYGSGDDEFHPADATATAARLRARTVLVIPGARHLGMLSDPPQTAGDIAQIDAALRSRS